MPALVRALKLSSAALDRECRRGRSLESRALRGSFAQSVEQLWLCLGGAIALLGGRYRVPPTGQYRGGVTRLRGTGHRIVKYAIDPVEE